MTKACNTFAQFRNQKIALLHNKNNLNSESITITYHLIVYHPILSKSLQHTQVFTEKSLHPLDLVGVPRAGDQSIPKAAKFLQPVSPARTGATRDSSSPVTQHILRLYIQSLFILKITNDKFKILDNIQNYHKAISVERNCYYEDRPQCPLPLRCVPFRSMQLQNDASACATQKQQWKNIHGIQWHSQRVFIQGIQRIIANPFKKRFARLKKKQLSKPLYNAWNQAMIVTYPEKPPRSRPQQTARKCSNEKGSHRQLVTLTR